MRPGKRKGQSCPDARLSPQTRALRPACPASSTPPPLLRRSYLVPGSRVSQPGLPAVRNFSGFSNGGAVSSIVFGHQHCGHRAVGLGDNPELQSRPGVINRTQTAADTQGAIVGLTIVVVQVPQSPA